METKQEIRENKVNAYIDFEDESNINSNDEISEELEEKEKEKQEEEEEKEEKELKIKISKRPKRRVQNVYSLCQITKTITLPFNVIGKNLNNTIEKTISSLIEGKCIEEGYVKIGSIKILTYSSGLIKGSNIIFDVVFECQICFPVSGMLINCVAMNITKAGIRGISSEEKPSPFEIFIARDHFYYIDYFNSIKENDKFVARVIAQRFELNDSSIRIIAELVLPKTPKKNIGTTGTKKPILII